MHPDFALSGLFYLQIRARVFIILFLTGTIIRITPSYGSSVKRTSAIHTCFPTSSPLSTCGLPSLWTSASSIRHFSMVWQRNSWCCLNTLFIYLIIETYSSKQSQNQQIVHVNNFTLEARPM